VGVKFDFLKCLECGRNSIKINKENNNKNFLCLKCKKRYPIEKDILNFIENKNAISHKSNKHWSFEWKKLKYNLNDKKNYFVSEKAFNTFIPIRKEEYHNKTILVLGCGKGKEIYHILKYKPKLVIGIDISSSIYAVKEEFKNQKNLILIRADIMELPFAKSYFDIIISDHVLQHVADWQKAVERASLCLKKNGILAFSVYSKENNGFMINLVEPLKKKFLFKVMSLWMIYYISFFVTVFLLFFIKLYKFLSIFGLGKKMPLYQHFLYWDTFSFNYLWKGTIFDLLHAPHTDYLSKDELIRMTEKLGLKNTLIYSNKGNLWCFRGVKG